MTRLSRRHPVRDILAASGLSQSELARRMGLEHPGGVANQLAREARGGSPSWEWVHRAADAAGLKIDTRATKKRRTPLAPATDR